MNAFKQLVQSRSNAEKTTDFIRDDRDNSRPLTYRFQKKIIIICLKSTSGLYWMLAEGVLEYAVISGLVMEQSGQGSSFSGLLASPCVPV